MSRILSYNVALYNVLGRPGTVIFVLQRHVVGRQRESYNTSDVLQRPKTSSDDRPAPLRITGILLAAPRLNCRIYYYTGYIYYCVYWLGCVRAPKLSQTHDRSHAFK